MLLVNPTAVNLLGIYSPFRRLSLVGSMLQSKNLHKPVEQGTLSNYHFRCENNLRSFASSIFTQANASACVERVSHPGSLACQGSTTGTDSWFDNTVADEKSQTLSFSFEGTARRLWTQHHEFGAARICFRAGTSGTTEPARLLPEQG